MKSWQDFLDSLSTSGGNVVTLFVCSGMTGFLWIWMANHMHGSDLTTAAGQIFSGFTGALLQAQKGNSSRQQMVDRAAAGGPSKDGSPPPPVEEPKTP
jgi:hypothetical protein